jgi:hypothetical protein
MSSRAPGITSFDDRGLAELKNELRRLWDAFEKVKVATIPSAVPEIPSSIGLSQVSNPTVPPEEDAVLPGKVTGLAVTNYSLFVDPTTGVTLASVQISWTPNLSEGTQPADVDIYEIVWYE